MSESKKGLTLPLLLALLVVQGLLVFTVFSPGAFSGGDNAGYVALADALVEQGAYVEGWEPGAPPHTKYPPIMAGLLAILVSLGAERWVTLKLISAVAAVGVSGVTFLWARRRIPEILAAGVALVTGMSATLLYHSSYILSDVPFLLFLMGAVALLEGEPGGAGSTSPAATSDDETTSDPLPVFAARPTGGAASSPLALGAGILLVFLACFTRTAGLPLFVALLGALALRRAWKPFAAAAVSIGLPWLLWGLRQGSEQGRYGSEFFLVNPYDPALGQVDVAGLFGRVFANVEGYLTIHLPAAIGGLAPGESATAVGVSLMLAGVVGWVMAIRRRRFGVVELFAPLYLGLLLIWPEVWSGERFAMPLVPILLLYAAEAIGGAGRRVGPQVELAAAGAALALMGAVAFSHVGTLKAVAEDCRAAIEASRGNPWSCGGPGQLEFVAAARWSGNLLPEGSVVLSRKPRIFYVESGLPSRVYPFEEDPRALFEEAAAIGARYVIFDRVSVQAARYLGSAIRQRPERFCGVRSFQMTQQGGTELLGILPEGATGGSSATGEGVRLEPCPADFVRTEIEPMSDPVDRIPILRDRSDN